MTKIVPFYQELAPGVSVEITDISLTLPEELEEEDWAEIGENLGRFDRRSQWCIGDWWTYGEHKYGERSYVVKADTWQGPPWSTCHSVGSVAKRFDKSVRRRTLSFEHHRAVMGLKDGNLALALLDRAERYSLSVAQVKAEVRAYKRRELQEDMRSVYSPGSATFCHASESELLEELKERSVDLLLTDPPYATDVDDIEVFSEWVTRWLPTLKPSGRAYIFTGAYPAELLAYLTRFKTLPEGWQLDNPLVWTYRNTLGPAPTHTYKLNWQACFHLYGPEAQPLNCPWMKEQFGVQDISAPDGRHGNRFHSWQKPDELAERLICHSTKEQQKVVDPFCGSGTFILAAKRLGRIGIGADIDEAAIKLCNQRLESEGE